MRGRVAVDEQPDRGAAVPLPHRPVSTGKDEVDDALDEERLTDRFYACAHRAVTLWLISSGSGNAVRASGEIRL
ncbi:hypothetical protein GCM10017772_19350 [Promicromonospora soli]|uniref:Uncharacterized protein n=1 Tax=Promicromonospora soli TaxID=2035533 RepID=A0A919KTC7_9MICO|nr:hypothetical protein GCM10017772_19350 [Promicromonospora soli]